MITIVDYGVGNVRAFGNYYRRAGFDVVAATTADELRGASKVVLPGVGSFDHAMKQLNQSGMRGVLEDLVLAKGVPVLGVCVGMQMLAAGSQEGDEPGLGWVKGWVRRLAAAADERNEPLPLPHMGWNNVHPLSASGLFAGLGSGARFYFLHSYYLDAADSGQVAAVAAYGAEFCCAVGSGHIHGVQFHPEKSHRWGAALLSNFAGL